MTRELPGLSATSSMFALATRNGLTGGFLASLTLKIVGALIGLLLSVVLARGLGVEGYGVYALALSVIAFLCVPIQLGLPTLLVREIARYQVNGRWALMRGLVRRADRAVLLRSLAVGIAAGAVIWGLSGRLEAAQLATLAVALVLLPLFALTSLRASALRGLRHVLQSQVPEVFVRPGALLLFACIAFSFGALSPSRAMALYCAAAVLAFVTGTIQLRRASPREMRTATPEYETADWVRSSLTLAMLSGLQIVISQTDVVMLGLLGSKEDVGLYRVAVSGSELVAFALSAVNLIVAPLIVRLHGSGERNRLQSVVTDSARLSLAFALPVGLVLIFLGSPILGFVYGDDFRPAYSALALLCCGQVVNAAMGSVGLILNMTGNERDTVNAFGIGAVFNVVLNLVLIPRYGLNGAALAASIALVLWNATLCRKVWLRLRIRSDAFRMGFS